MSDWGTEALRIGNLDGGVIHIAVETITITELSVGLLQKVPQVFGLSLDLLEGVSRTTCTRLTTSTQKFTPGRGILLLDGIHEDSESVFQCLHLFRGGIFDFLEGDSNLCLHGFGIAQVAPDCCKARYFGHLDSRESIFELCSLAVFEFAMLTARALIQLRRIRAYHP